MLTPDALGNGQQRIKEEVNDADEQTPKVEIPPTENAITWTDAVQYYEGFLLENQARISGEGTKWLPLNENGCTHWSTNSPLARVHIRRRRESLKTIPTIKVRACVPDSSYMQARNLATDNEKLNEKRALRAVLPRSRWRSEEQLSPITRTVLHRCLVGENSSSSCNATRPTAHRALSEKGLPCLQCKDSNAHTFAIRELKRQQQQQLRRKNCSVTSLNPPKDSSAALNKFECNGWANVPDVKKMAVHLVRSDDVIWSNRTNGSSCNNNNNNNNNNYHRDRVAFLRANSTALISASGDGGRAEGTQQQQETQAPWQPLGGEKAFVPLLLQDIEDFEAISDMESRLSESSLSLDNDKQAGVCCALPRRCWRCCCDHLDYCQGLCLNCPTFWSILFLLIDIPCALCFCI